MKYEHFAYDADLATKGVAVALKAREQAIEDIEFPEQSTEEFARDLEYQESVNRMLKPVAEQMARLNECVECGQAGNNHTNQCVRFN